MAKKPEPAVTNGNQDAPKQNDHNHVKIAPTVGRVVWYVPSGMDMDHPDHQPYRADICYVNADGTINIAFNEHDGSPGQAQNVTLVQEGDTHPDTGFCMWMPYQQGQAKKHA